MKNRDTGFSKAQLELLRNQLSGSIPGSHKIASAAEKRAAETELLIQKPDQSHAEREAGKKHSKTESKDSLGR